MIGKQIANYRIEDKLGEGGMGVVYKAMDVDLDRPVAIKVLSADLSSDPALIERFRGEAKAQALLNHANIASLYTLLNVEGHVGIVMEYLEGETLDQIIQRRGLLPWEEALPWFKQALLGVGFAHRRGIIHRDIKPSNIMVNRYGTVKVMDFGIAKVIGGQKLTKTGMNVGGTVAYMSPEQVRNEPVDVRSDIYCLGVTLYELLTAHLPFESASEFQVMSDHVHTPPPALRQHYPYVPPGIEAAVLKALAKRPKDRFQSVEEFGVALEHPGEASARPAATVVYPPAGAASSSAVSAAALGTGWEGAQSSGAGAFAQSASGAQPGSAAGTGNSDAAVAPRMMAGHAPAPTQGVGAAGAKLGNKKLLYGAGAAAAVLVVGLVVFAMRPKPVTVASGQLGGGGQVQSTGSSGGSGADSTSAHGSAQQAAASTSGLDKSDSAAQPNIMQALNADKAIGKGAGADLTAPSSGRNAGATSLGGRSTTKRSGGGQGTKTPDTDRQPPPNQQQEAQTPSPIPPQPPGPSDAELEGANEDLVKIRGRMDAVHQSLTTLKQEQAAQGLGLRGDIVASESRLYSFYELADRALQQKNLTSAQRNMQQAETELEKIEHFLGR